MRSILQSPSRGIQRQFTGVKSTSPIDFSGPKYWQMIADGLHRAGWSYGVTAFLTRDGRTFQCVDAHKDGKRCVVHAEELGAAFLELEAQCRAINRQEAGKK